MLADEGGGVKQRNRTRRRSRSRSLGCLGLGLALCASGPGGGASAFVPTPQSQAQSTGSVLSGMDSRGGSRSGCVRQRAPPQVPPSGSAWSCVGHESPMIGSGVNTGERVEEDNNLCTRVLSLRLTTFNLLAPCYKRIDRTTNAAERKGSSILQSSLFQGAPESIAVLQNVLSSHFFFVVQAFDPQYQEGAPEKANLTSCGGGEQLTQLSLWNRRWFLDAT
jgi:hypothetical protein